MSAVKLAAPKRRRRTRLTGEPPFPIPIETTTGEAPAEDNWNYFTGVLIDDHVVVQQSGDIDCLYRMGFFGKGNLSRNKPEYNRGFWNIRQRRGDGQQEQDVLRVVSKRRYLQHQAWKTGLTEAIADDSTGIMRKRRRRSQFAHGSEESFPRPTFTPEHDIAMETRQTEETPNPLQTNIKTEETVSGAEKVADEPTLDWGQGLRVTEKAKETDDPWSQASKLDTDQFWGMASGHEGCLKAGTGSENKDNVDPWELDTKNTSASAWSVASGTDDGDDHEAVESSQNTNNDGALVIKTCEKSSRKDRSLSGDDKSPGDISTSNLSREKNLSVVQQEDKAASVTDTSVECKTVSSSNDITPTEGPVLKTNPANVLHEHSEKEHLPETLDPMCKSEDMNGELYVVHDTEGSEEEEEVTGGDAKKKRLKWIPTRKNDPFPLEECLHLTFEEAFFLSYGLGCLVVLDNKRDSMDLEQMWRTFYRKRPNFVRNYIAYHSLRSRGWVPKTGLKYGADYIVYHKGPAFYHGTYSVLVRSSSQADLRDDLDLTNRPLTWSSVMGIDRVTEQVAKEVLIMQVLRPSDMTDEELNSPLCIPRFKIQEILVNRWVPSKDRESSEVEEWL